MIMRIRYQKLGGHYHCRVFTAPSENQTFAKVGELLFDERDWIDRHKFFSMRVEFINDDPPMPEAA